jgi:hypothetical protein
LDALGGLLDVGDEEISRALDSAFALSMVEEIPPVADETARRLSLMAEEERTALSNPSLVMPQEAAEDSVSQEWSHPGPVAPRLPTALWVVLSVAGVLTLMLLGAVIFLLARPALAG